jgi:hypothetical protein
VCNNKLISFNSFIFSTAAYYAKYKVERKDYDEQWQFIKEIANRKCMDTSKKIRLNARNQ